MLRRLFMKFTILLLVAILSNVPHVAMAELVSSSLASSAQNEMIATVDVVEELTQEQAIEKIKGHIHRAEVESELQKLGISTSEIEQRLTSLSESEIQNLANQMDQATYGSGVTGILVIVVLVLLIIYLAKRI